MLTWKSTWSTTQRVVMALMLLAWVHDVAAQSVSEPWRATALSERWNLEQWGASCGPKPEPSGVPAAIVTVTRRGGELYFDESGRQYSTMGCWERYPGLHRAKHHITNGSWVNVCRTQPNDPRQAVVRTTVSASDGQITWRETGEYRLVTQGTECRATVTRARRFTRAEPTSEHPASPAADGTPADSLQQGAAGGASRRCATPGGPARLTVSPSLLWASPGKELALTVKVYDSDGCGIAAPVRWEPPARAPLSVSPAGVVRVTADASAGEYPIVVSASPSVRATLRFHVVAPADVAGFLNQQRSEQHAAMRLQGPANERRSLGSKAAMAENRAVVRKRWFVAIGVGISLLLGALGVVLLRQPRRASAAGLSPAPPEATAGGAEPARRCPTCGQVYTNGALYCGVDGQPLHPA